MILNIKNIQNRRSLQILVILLMISPGCNDWIDIEPENDLIKQEFWKTRDDVMSVLAATYDAFRGTTEKSFLLGEVRGDFIFAQGGPLANYRRIGNNDISSTNTAVKWDEYYYTINLANTVMYYAPQIQELDLTLTDKVLSSIESEMLFIRSMCYFYLVRLWKDVPLVLTPTVSDTVDFYIPKSTENEILSQLIQDLKIASSGALKDEFITNPSFYKGRANIYSIHALLADIYLWKEDYINCIAYCDSIINAGIFGLEPNNSWFDLYNPGNSLIESIFEIQFDDDLEAQHNPMLVEGGTLANIGADIDRITYDEENDIRFCNGKGPLWKYRGNDETGDENRIRSVNERDANFIYYRYADILLMKAEALAELMMFEDANYLVRAVAERAGVTHVSTFSLSSFRTSLITERGKEFAGEGKRWFDLLRFAKKNKFEDKQRLIDILLSKASDAKELALMRSKVIDTLSYYLPIYEEELQFNRELIQNSFYDR